MLPKGPYKPNENENEMLEFWLKNNFYSPDYKSNKAKSTAAKDKRDTFTIILPPPNANGNLHLGHMSGYAYQDLMGRYNRMQGKEVLLLPGKDHAGIQTEVVFERELEQRGLDKQTMGREKFYHKCYDFCMKNSEIARSQEQKIGLSADFERELFTLDPRIVNEVLEAFRLMYNDKLVYRGKRLINWCVRCQSALADIDTEYKDAKTNFFYFKYGFLTPEEEALKIKAEFENKESIEVKVERTISSDGETKYPFVVTKPINEFNIASGPLNIYCIGFDTGKIADGEILKVKPIAIMMRLDKKFRLVAVNLNFEGDIDGEIKKIWDIAMNKREAGVHFIRFDKYPEDKFYTNGFTLATVRPETKFGDTAIACHPDDPRYQDFIGKEFEVMTLNGPAKIKLIADNAVDMDTGTGVLKVTPAHAIEDWDIAQRHPEDTLPEKQVIGFDGKLNHLTGKYAGKTVKEAREMMITDMKEIGMLVYLDTEYENRIRVCERCKSQIEPLISYQWFVDTKPLKAKAKQLVESGITEVMPEGMRNRYIQWMETPEDWCITRQLWWGYRLPVWYKGGRSQYVTETGEVKEKIGEKIIETDVDYRGLVYVGHGNPNHSDNKVFLVPGKHGFAYREFFPSLHSQFLHTQTLKVENLSDPSYVDYETVFKQTDFDESSIVVAHSLGTRAILRYLINNNIKIKALILIAPATKPREKDQASAYAELFNDNELYSKVNNLIESVDVIYADNDELADIEKFEWFTSLIPQAQGHLEKNKAHYAGKDYTKHSSKLTSILNEKLIVSDDWQQDEDVLDTWFSSGQWPYITLKANQDDYQRFYSTQVMETGWDILIFWVTRMMLLNPYRALRDKFSTEDINELFARTELDREITPFKDVYLHGLVQDKNGQKMSKSKGNGIDPFEMMQKYGTDALRFSFIVGNAAGQNYRLYDEKIASYRNFCNKIWNASKFSLMNFEHPEVELTNINRKDNQLVIGEKIINLPQEDIDMLDHMQELITETTRRIDNFQFGIAAQELYESFWHKLADAYIETIKSRLYTKDKDGNPINNSDLEKDSRLAAQWTLYYVLEVYLKMLHPFIPFITEKIWQELPHSEDRAESIMYSEWPV